jgi:hypothetical protein
MTLCNRRISTWHCVRPAHHAGQHSPIVVDADRTYVGAAMPKQRIRAALNRFALTKTRTCQAGERKCCFCGHAIQPGDQYRNASTIRTHEICFQAVAREFNAKQDESIATQIAERKAEYLALGGTTYGVCPDCGGTGYEHRAECRSTWQH